MEMIAAFSMKWKLRCKFGSGWCFVWFVVFFVVVVRCVVVVVVIYTFQPSCYERIALIKTSFWTHFKWTCVFGSHSIAIRQPIISKTM